ncbi:MAG: ribbon-helix-helix protein, CopG family [Verrucomicrobia bacterium]|nr:ribbon-helix-helix protein, CopG family [Verrucomicrobiota bacterium]
MAPMTVRTTVAFDPVSAARLERLAKRWGVSKSETLRRALAMSDNTQPAKVGKAPEFTGMTPLQILAWLRENPSPPVPGGWGDDPHRELREMRELDAKIEDERERPGSKVAETGTHYEP